MGMSYESTHDASNSSITLTFVAGTAMVTIGIILYLFRKVVS